MHPKGLNGETWIILPGFPLFKIAFGKIILHSGFYMRSGIPFWFVPLQSGSGRFHRYLGQRPSVRRSEWPALRTSLRSFHRETH